MDDQNSRMLSLPPEESEAVDRLALAKGLTPNGVVTAALRLFESVAVGQLAVTPTSAEASKVCGSSTGVVWHSIDDALPDDEMTVLLVYEDTQGGLEVWLGYLEDGRNWYVAEGWAIEKPVRFWAELPMPPQVKASTGGGPRD